MALLATRSSALGWLLGARVQRVDIPVLDCLALSLYRHDDKRSLLLSFGPANRGIGSVGTRPKGLAASPFVRRLRTLIEGSRLQAAEWLTTPSAVPSAAPPTRALALELTFARAELQTRLVVDFDARFPNLFLLREDDTIAGAADERSRRERFSTTSSAYALGRGPGLAIVVSDSELHTSGAGLLERTAESGRTAVRARLEAQTRAALKRVERKLAAIQGDIDRAESAPRLRREADALLCNLHAIARGAASVRVPDPNSDPPVDIVIELDPAKDARRNAEQRFERARKLERGVSIASARLRETATEAALLREKLAALSAPDADLTDFESSPRAAQQALRTRKPQARVPYRTFVGHGGKQILVGKGAADNDALTLTVARPHDHWLHVRDSPGSHVVVPLDRKATIHQELLLDAAHLAAHFSRARGEALIEIAHTERRFVRKRKGAPPGSVSVDRERVFLLRCDAARLARLLGAEHK